MAESSANRIAKKALRKIVPTSKEKACLEGLAYKVLDVANKEASRHGAHAILAGSLTRNTWLRGKMEFDVFILFPESVKEDDMESAGLRIGKDVIKKMKGNHFIEYAEHPYVCGKIGKMDVDIVPCYEICSTESLKSAVDRTPFHVRYIEKKLPKSLSDDVRLMKQLCSANGIYGADAKTEGFSGYVCELLIIKYGGFVNALKAISEWSPGQIIDIESAYRKEDYESLKSTFKDNSLILVDPTDQKRNTAAAVSHSSFQKMVSIAKSFIRLPSEKFFFHRKSKPMSLTELKRTLAKRDTEVIVVKFRAPKVVPDILWPQLRRLAHRLASILEENDFSVLRTGVHAENEMAAVLIEMENCKLPSVRKRIGPSVFDQKGSKSFIEKYKGREGTINGPFVEDGFWVVETERKFRTAKSKLDDSLKKPLSILKDKGIPSHVANEISKRYEILSETGRIASMSRKYKGFGVFLRGYFDKSDV